MTQDSAKIIQNEITGLEIRGSSHLAEAWFAGVQSASVVTEKNPSLSTHVILLSDGHANVGMTDPGELSYHTQQLQTLNFKLSTLGIGDGYDPERTRCHN